MDLNGTSLLNACAKMTKVCYGSCKYRVKKDTQRKRGEMSRHHNPCYQQLYTLQCIPDTALVRPFQCGASVVVYSNCQYSSAFCWSFTYCSFYLVYPCGHLLGKSCSLAFSLVLLFSVVLVVRVPFPFGVWESVWYSIVSVPDLCLFIYFANTYIDT